MTTLERLSKIERIVTQRQAGVLVLEDVQERANLHACTRSFEACGFQRVCVIFDQVKPYSVRRGGISRCKLSATRWLDFEVYRSTADCLGQLHKEGYELLATVPQGDAENLYSARLDNPRIALMFGNESRGLSDAALSQSDRFISIPMRGMVQSLNIASCAAICLFEITRQRHALGIERFMLPENVQRGLVESFTQRRNKRSKVW